MDISKSTEENRKTLVELYSLAFPEEDLVPLLNDLLDEQESVLSLVAIGEDNALKGHAVLTMCTADGCSDKVALLGPIAVHPDAQKQGIGGKLIRRGFDFMKENGVSEVYVLGDPAYYGRFGFQQCDHVSAPYNIPEEWASGWQFINLNDSDPSFQGRLSVPKPWRNPKLWAA